MIKNNFFGGCKLHVWQFLIVALLLNLQQTVRSQVITYSFVEDFEPYAEITTPFQVAYGDPGPGYDNHTNGSAHLAELGFSFVYDGVTHTQCYISTNGFITFGATQPSGTLYFPINSAVAYQGAISAMGIYLRSDTDEIRYKTTGNAPNRVFTVQWKNVYRSADPSKGLMNFQIKLYETSNIVKLHYGSCNPENPELRTVQVGLRGANNVFAQGNAKNRLQSGTANINDTWATRSVDGTQNSSSMRTSQIEYPDNGLVYEFTPSIPCVTPTGTLGGLTIGGTNVTVSSFVGNTINPGSSTATNFVILRSTENTPPPSTLFVNRTYFVLNQLVNGIYTVVHNSSATTFNQTGLTNNTTYYYWMIPYNDRCFGAPFYQFAGMISTSNTTCIPAPVLSPTTNITGNEFTATWSAVPGAVDYELQVSNNSTYTNLVPGYEAVSSSGNTTLTITGLEPLRTYFYRVKAIGNGPCSLNSVSFVVPMPCGYYTIPYAQNFDTTPVNTLTQCYALANDNADDQQWSVQAINPASAPRTMYLNTNTPTASNDWFFTPGLLFQGGTNYRLFFRVNTGAAGTFSERLRIRVGTGASTVAMNSTILELPDIVNTVYQNVIVDFNIATTGVYHLGFQAYSAANQSYIVIDDLEVTVAPSCFEPQEIVLASSGITTATINFLEPTVVPSIGYEYVLSTNPTAPNDSTTPNGTIAVGVSTLNLTGLNSSTQYYLWIRGNCGPGDKSIWSQVINFSTDCNPPTFTSVTDGNRCGNGVVNLQAVPNLGSVTHWYDSPGGNLLATGNNFITPSLTTSTVYYAQAKASGATATIGLTSPSSISGARTVLTEQVITNFNVSEPTTLLSFDIYPITSGQNGFLVLRNSLGVAISSTSFTTSGVGGSTPQTIALNLDLVTGNYTVQLVNVPASGLICNIDNVAFPYVGPVASINGNNYDNSFYIYFYNWKFTTTCQSAIVPVNATVTLPPALNLSSTSDVICSGETTGLITLTGTGSYNTFTWSPASGVSGTAATGYTFNPIESTIYTLTASQTSGAQCVVSRTFNLTVNPSPPDITIVPATADLCEGDIQSFSATFGANSEINIFVENFEGDISGWTIENNSTGFNIDAGVWTLRESPYEYASAYWTFNASSNDASKFMVANSDAQGTPSSNRTLTTLTSPNFSLDGYTTATLSFWHFLLWINTNRAHVLISTDDGANWTLLNAYTGVQGLSASFINSAINLDAYIGSPQVKLRFLYDATWDYGWMIDNIRVSGTVSTAVNWSPVDDLYIDDLATIPYTAGTPAGTVYCLPTTDRTYTARVNTIDGCFSEANFSVGFSPQPVGGVIPSGENLCVGGTPGSLPLTGYSGNILRWERADDPAFTVNVTPIAFTGDVLTPAEMGAITTVRYFRAVVGSGVCPVVYSNVAAISYPTSVWNGTVWSNGVPDASTQAVINVAGNATISNDIVACSLQVVSGNISVASGVTIRLQGTINVSGGSLTFENEASLLQVDSTPNTGTIVYRRNSQPMWLYDYTYWSSPVAAQNVKQFSPNTNLIRFYTYQGGVNWVRVFPNQAAFDAGAATMTPGRGYIIRAPGSGVPQFYAFGDPSGPTVYPGVFNGVPNNGTYTAPINITASNVFNFVGNPYPSALDIHEFLLDPDNLGVIERTIYLWTHNTPITNNNYNAGDYATYNFMGGVSSDPGTGAPSPNPGVNTNAPTRYIASGQGFILYGLTNGTVSFKNSMRVAGNNNSFFRMAAPNQQTEAIESIEKYRLWLNMTNQTNLNQQLMVGFSDMASDGYDDGFDAKAPNSAYGLQFYSLHEDEPLSIQAKGLPFHHQQTFPIGYTTQEAGMYHVFLTQFDAFFGTQAVYLHDLWTGVMHDLKSGPYSFASDSGVFHGRFQLRFTNETLGVELPSFSKDILVVQAPGSLSVQAVQTTLHWVELYDLTGRLLLSRKANGSVLEHFMTLGIERQAVLMKITDQEGKIHYKKTIVH
jgi:hypothetical protein